MDVLPPARFELFNREKHSACQVSPQNDCDQSLILLSLSRYQGDMTRPKRDQAVKVFMAKEKAKVMLMSLKCGGEYSTSATWSMFKRFSMQVLA